MATYTSTHTSPPTCENCGRDKQATYICDACCAKLNAATRKLTAERDELQRRLVEVVDSLNPGECKDWLGGYWLQKHTLWTRAVAIAEGRTG